MESIDVNNRVHLNLVRGAIVLVDNELFQIEDIDYSSIHIANPLNHRKIEATAWNPVILDKNWLKTFNIPIGSKIHDIEKNTDWMVKALGLNLHLTIYLASPCIDVPVIGLRFVHELQIWYYRLTGQHLLCPKLE